MSNVKNVLNLLNPDWIVGFVDGEGCFFVGMSKNKTMKLGIQILPEFIVVQHLRDKKILDMFLDFFGCGVVRVNHGDRLMFRVRGQEALMQKIIPFFDKYPLKTSKQQNYLLFREIVFLIDQKEHLTPTGIRKIEHLKEQMNTKVFKPSFEEPKI